jgi:hypothetical protein
VPGLRKLTFKLLACHSPLSLHNGSKRMPGVPLLVVFIISPSWALAGAVVVGGGGGCHDDDVATAAPPMVVAVVGDDDVVVGAVDNNPNE